jgi:hypothetical protein
MQSTRPLGRLRALQLCQALDRVLARRIERQVRGTVFAHGRGNIDDAAGALALHHAQLVLKAERAQSPT